MNDNVVKFRKRTPEKTPRQQKTAGQRPARQRPVWLNQVLVFVLLFAGLALSYAYFTFTAP